MANSVEICNMGLSMLGDQSITSLDDDTTRAALCRVFLPMVKKAVLRSHPWKCALKRATLARLAEVPEFGFDCQFQLPPDKLRVLAVDDSTITWTIEGNKLLSDSANVKILYIADIDYGYLDSMLVDVVATRLAMELAHAITDKANLIDGLWKLFQMKLGEARTMNATEGSPQAFISNDLIDVRN